MSRGSRFRRVALDGDSPRRGLLGQGSVLTATSAGNRTSPVKRGKWILENLLGAPVPSPPPGVETNLEKSVGAGRGGDVAAPAARAPSRQPGLRVVSRGHGPDRVRARELRPDREMARNRRRRPGECRRQARGRHAARRPGQPAPGAACTPRRVRHQHHREAANLRAGPPARVLRHAGRPGHRPRRRRPTTGCRRSSSASSRACRSR